MGWTVGQDNGDGTGQELVYDDDGTLVETRPLIGLSIPVVTPDPLHQLAQAIVDADTLDDVKPVAQAILGNGQ